MTKEKILQTFEDINLVYNDCTRYDTLKRMLDELQEPCKDAISRQAVLNVVEKAVTKEVARWSIKELPPVNPQKPKTGHWIRVDKDKLRCSECEVIHLIAQYPNGKINWCPNCGAKMVEPQEEKQEPCDDAISRTELLKAIDTWDKFGYTETGCFVREPKNDCVKYIHYDDVIKCIKGMPPVNTQKPICPSAGVDCEDCPAYEPKVLNKWIGAEVLDRIRNEMHATAEKHEDGVYYLRDEWIDEIIDKYAEGSGEE